jgi:hypothetical protein
MSRLSQCRASMFALIPMLLAMGLCWVAGEFYPLSSFPMYSKFDDRTYLVYVKSASGETLPTVPTFSMVSSQLKKRYGAELAELKQKYKGSHFDWTVEQKSEAGEKTLAYLRDTFAPQAFADGKLDGLQLIDVRIRRTAAGLEKTEQQVGSLK